MFSPERGVVRGPTGKFLGKSEKLREDKLKTPGLLETRGKKGFGKKMGNMKEGERPLYRKSSDRRE